MTSALAGGLEAGDLGLSALVGLVVVAIVTGRLVPTKTVKGLLEEKERLIARLEQAHRDDQTTITLLLDSTELTTRVVAAIHDEGARP